MFVLVKLVGLYDYCSFKIVAVSNNKLKIEDEAKRIEQNNALFHKIDDEIFNLTAEYRDKNPFTTPRPLQRDKIVEWQNLELTHYNNIKEEAKQEVLAKYGLNKIQDFDRNLTFKIYEIPEL